MNDKKIPANHFVKEMIGRVAQALVTPLKGVDKPTRIVIEVTEEDPS